jgi:hypothetical protein
VAGPNQTTTEAATSPPGAAPTRSTAAPGPEPSQPLSDKPIGALLNELKDLVVAYAKQETLDPIKALGRFVAFGLLSTFLLAVGCSLVVLALIRAIQSETGQHLTGDLSWVPYAGGILFGLMVAGIAATRIGKAPK